MTGLSVLDDGEGGRIISLSTRRPRTAGVPREWDYEPNTPGFPRVKDLTPRLPGSEQCGGKHPQGWTCTRHPDHTGRHTAGNGVLILAVWEASLTDEDEAAVGVEERAAKRAVSVFDAFRATTHAGTSDEVVWERVAAQLQEETSYAVLSHHEGDGAPRAFLDLAVEMALAAQRAAEYAAAEHEAARPGPDITVEDEVLAAPEPCS